MLRLYRALAYLGLASIFGSMLVGFRYDPLAPRRNIAIVVLLYLAYMVPHLVMTRAWFKRSVWKQPGGSPAERRVYITIASVLWIAIFLIHPAIPGRALNTPEWVILLGVLAFILCLRSFFEGSTIERLDGLFGMPGSTMSHTHGAETPLLMDGPYARVRHPHYQAVVLACASTLLMHPNTAQLLWVTMIALTFISFIPIEEAQLIAARGDDYRNYQKQTPYRLFRGIW